MSENEDYVFTWKIVNYSCCFKARGEFIDSPVFTLENLHKTEWSLCFYPRGHPRLEEGQNYVSFFLQWKLSDKFNETPPIEYNLEILNGNHKSLKSLSFKSHVFSKEAASWGYDEFLDSVELGKNLDSTEDILLLRCCIKYPKLNEPIPLGSEAHTVFEVEDRRCFEWDVTIPSLPKHSQSIFVPFLNLCNFEITLVTLVKGLEISFHLRGNDKDLPETIMFGITLYNKIGSKVFSERAKTNFQDSEVWKFPDFVTQSSLESCLVDNNKYVFKLKCEVYVLGKNNYKTEVAMPVIAIQNDFRNLFIDKKYCDVIIRSGNEVFHAHKLVLRVRSPVLEAMFSHNMLENETSTIDIHDVDGQTLKIFLEFLYTGTVEKLDFESAKKLLLLADKYQVPSLVDVSVSFLTKTLSTGNACEILSTADLVNCETLKTSAFDFIISNADKILITPEWEKWIGENIMLATKVLSKLSADIIGKYK